MYPALYGVSFSVVSLFCVARRASWILTKSTAQRGREIDSGLGTLLKCDRKNRRRRRCETGFAKRWHNDARPGEGEFNVSRISASPTLYDLTIQFLLFSKMEDESVLYFAEDSDRSLGNFELPSFRKETFINMIDTLRRCRLQITYLRVFDYHHESKYFIRDIYWFLTFNFGNNNEICK